MNEDWLHKVRDCMADYETDEPAGLWESIEAAQDAPSPKAPSGKTSDIWIRRGIAAAAVALIAIVTGIYLIDFPAGSDSARLSLACAQAGDVQTGAADSRLIAEVPVHRHIAYSPYAAPLSRNDSRPTATAEDEVTDATETETVAVTDTQTDPSAGSEPATVTDSESDTRSGSPKRHPDDDRHVSLPVRADRQGSKLSVGIYSSGGTGSMLNFSGKGQGFGENTNDPGIFEGKDPLLVMILQQNKGRDISTDIKHRLPVRAGVAFTYNLTGRLGIESGLTYTNLTSDIREGSDKYFFTGEQRLHYIGIPLNVKYRLLSRGIFDLYASCGGLAEKCVSATLHRDYFLDGRKEGSGRETLSERPVQWSVNASLGVQCRLISAMSIYAEPGVSYYFDDGTSLRTIYKEKPLNFNLNIGLRFTFGK